MVHAFLHRNQILHMKILPALGHIPGQRGSTWVRIAVRSCDANLEWTSLLYKGDLERQLRRIISRVLDDRRLDTAHVPNDFIRRSEFKGVDED